MNKAILVGRLTRDPEIRVAGSTQKPVGRFSMAISMGKDQVEYINCTAFDKKADLLEKYFHKGDRIGVIGRIHNGSYTNKDGQKVTATEIWVDEIEFLQDKREEPRQATLDDFGIPQDVKDEDLPF